MAGDDIVRIGDKPAEVPFSDDEVVRDEELILDDSKDPAERSRRSEERKRRGQEREAERKRLAEEVKAAREEAAKTARELAELRGYVAAKAAPTPPDGKDEFDRRLDAVYEKQREAFTSYQAEALTAGGEEKIKPERKRHYESVARAIEAEKAEVIAEKVLSRRAPAQEMAQAQQVWRQKYPEVYQDPRALQYATATWKRREAMGAQPSNEIVDEIMEETRATFKLGPKRAPSERERASMSGMPSGGGGGGGSSSGGIQMTKELRQMATALYSDLPEDQAVKKWVDGAGKALRAKKVL